MHDAPTFLAPSASQVQAADPAQPTQAALETATKPAESAAVVSTLSPQHTIGALRCA